MITTELLENIYNSLLNQDLVMAYQYRKEINEYIVYLLQKDILTNEEVYDCKLILMIGNITYNNLDISILPIEDGIYDLLIEKYRKYTSEDIYPVGAPNVIFDTNQILHLLSDNDKSMTPLMTKESSDSINYRNNMLFPELIEYHQPRITSFEPVHVLPVTQKITKRTHDTAHGHPTLVGTFDKCKYVLNSQAAENGVLNDSNVRVLERDFFQPLLQQGVIGYNDEITIIAELKYDGISVEADVNSKVLSARSRGDTGEGIASDITPLLEGYDFNNGIDEVIGMKFEAIISYPNLYEINRLEGKDYKNCRTAMSGLCSNSFGRKYRDYIRLIPISTDKLINGEPIDRLVELEFLNKYYTTGIPMIYTVFSGNYMNILYQMKRFVEEAEYARSYLPFMYDGVVFEFYDSKIRTLLGRDHSIDRYKVAIKFNPLKKQTIFRGYTYTIGQDGSVTPMIHYDPVEFMGTIHDKSSGHSYERFKTLDLHIGDLIDVKYMNDVMPYVTKPMNNHNERNAKDMSTLVNFPTNCPSCGSPIAISYTGKSAFCTNLYCREREIKRMASTLDKLGVKDFSEKTVALIGYTHLYQYLEADVEKFNILGPNDKYNLYNQLDAIRKKPIADYKIFGSLGFNNTAMKTWKLIFMNITINDFFQLYQQYNDMSNLKVQLMSIKGIGPNTVDIILNELPYFWDDIQYICKNMNIVDSKRLTYMDQKQIRFTGCRDQQLVEHLSNLGYDIDGNSGLTKKTDILLIPYRGYTQGRKYEKALQYGITIVPIEEFRNNLDQYL